MQDYKSPLWQKKRLQILERDNWRCVGCGDKDSPLNVHHIRYGKKPWSVDNEDLQTLCEECHELIVPHPKGGVAYERWDGTVKHVTYHHCPLCANEAFMFHDGGIVCKSCYYHIENYENGSFISASNICDIHDEPPYIDMEDEYLQKITQGETALSDLYDLKKKMDVYVLHRTAEIALLVHDNINNHR